MWPQLSMLGALWYTDDGTPLSCFFLQCLEAGAMRLSCDETVCWASKGLKTRKSDPQLSSTLQPFSLLNRQRTHRLRRSSYVIKFTARPKWPKRPERPTRCR
eukprot:1141515-Pelagomonas_calceolata.AAC.10